VWPQLSPRDSRLLSAVAKGDSKQAKFALADGADVNAVSLDTTMLGWAAQRGAAAVVPLLVAAGASPDQPGPDGRTPLMHAAEHGKLKAIGALLAAGADVNRRGVPAPVARRTVHGIPVPTFDHMHETGTPLIMAAKRGRADVVKALVAAGADPSIADADGLTAHDWAFRSQNRQVLSLLRRAAPGAKSGVVQFVAAARAGDVKAVRAAIAAGADVNAVEPDWFPRDGSGARDTNDARAGTTPLMAAAGAGHGDVVKLLLDAGADTEILSTTRNRSRRTALAFAVEAGHADVVRQLFAAGAKLEPADSDVSLIHEAAEAGDPEVLRLLVAAGADVNEPLQRSTPLHTAAKQGKPPAVKALLEAGARADPKDWERKTPLWEAAFGGYPEMVKTLLDAGADPNAKDQDGLSPLTAAVFGATNIPGSRKPYVEVARLLLDAGAEPARARAELAKERIRSKDLRRIADMLDKASVPSKRRPPQPRKKKATSHTAEAYADAPVPDFRDRAGAAPFRNAVAQLARTLKRAACPFEHDVPGAAFFKAKKARVERLIADRREKLLRSGVLIFRCGEALDPDGDDCLALLPTADLYEAVAAVGTNAANYGRGSAGVIAGLTEIERECPFVLTAIAFDRVEGYFLSTPKSPTRLARKLYDLNDDIGPIDQVAQKLRKDRRLYLWWD